MVFVGDTKADVLTKCGEPFLKEVVGQKVKGAVKVYRRGRYYKYGGTEVDIEKWFYKMEYGRFGRVLTFNGWKLVKIEQTDMRTPAE